MRCGSRQLARRGYSVKFGSGRRASNLPSTVGSILSNVQSEQICGY